MLVYLRSKKKLVCICCVKKDEDVYDDIYQSQHTAGGGVSSRGVSSQQAVPEQATVQSQPIYEEIYDYASTEHLSQRQQAHLSQRQQEHLSQRQQEHLSQRQQEHLSQRQQGQLSQRDSGKNVLYEGCEEEVMPNNIAREYENIELKICSSTGYVNGLVKSTSYANGTSYVNRRVNINPREEVFKDNVYAASCQHDTNPYNDNTTKCAHEDEDEEGYANFGCGEDKSYEPLRKGKPTVYENHSMSEQIIS